MAVDALFGVAGSAMTSDRASASSNARAAIVIPPIREGAQGLPREATSHGALRRVVRRFCLRMLRSWRSTCAVEIRLRKVERVKRRPSDYKCSRW